MFKTKDNPIIHLYIQKVGFRISETDFLFCGNFLFLTKIYHEKIVILIYILIFGVSFAQEKDILKVLHEQQTAWNNGDIENFLKGYWKDDSLLFIGSKGPTYGWQKTLDNYKKTYPNKEMMGILEFSDIQVKMLGKKHAYVFGKWKLIRANDTPNGIYTLVFQKFNDGWKIISDHTN